MIHGYNTVRRVINILKNRRMKGVLPVLLAILPIMGCSPTLPRPPKTHPEAFSPFSPQGEPKTPLISEEHGELASDSTHEPQEREWWLARPRFDEHLEKNKKASPGKGVVQSEKTEYVTYSGAPWPLVRRNISRGETVYARSTVWPEPAAVVAVHSDSARIETTWIRVNPRVNEDFHCNSTSGGRIRARIVANVNNYHDQAVVRTLYEFQGAEECQISERAYDRLSAFATDVVVGLYRIMR